MSALLAVVFLAKISAADRPKILAARNLGLAQLEEGRNKEARKTFERLGEMLPQEPLGFADAAVAALRDKDLTGADALLARATKAGGERASLLALRAAIEEARNRSDAALEAWEKAAALDPKDLESRWRFARAIEGSATSAPSPARSATRRRFLAEIVSASPANLPARLKLLVDELQAGAIAEAAAHLSELARLLEGGDAKTTAFLAECRSLLEKGDAKAASLKARVVENLLRVTSRYQQSLGELFTNVEGIPLDSFSPGLEAELRPSAGAPIAIGLVPASIATDDPGTALRRVDLSNSGKADLYAIPAPFTGAAFLDFDLDGDLDVYLFGGGKGDSLRRNNLDGTWRDVTAETGDSAFASTKAIAVDLDRDGDTDLVAIDAKGALLLRDNLRQGRFATKTLLPSASDVDAGDLNADGIPDLAVATPGGVTLLLSDGRGGRSNSTVPQPGVKKVLLADLDNDGLVDLLAASDKSVHAFRNAGNGTFTAWAIAPSGERPVERWIARDVDGDGDLDVVISARGKTTVLRNDGGNTNAWLDVVVEGLATGSGKVNRADVGTVVEVKAGDLYSSAVVGLLPTHVGLGAHAKADVVRCVFPNGVPQNAFDVRARAVMKEVQKLKGSCPFVYAKNGETGEWTFVSDALGRAPLGLLFDGVHLAGADPREWLFVDGDALRKDAEGRLTIDYTEELWEVTFLDEATLLAVDHPAGTRVVPNEKMVPSPLEKKLYTVRDPRPLRAATSEAGGTSTDVLATLARRDGNTVDPGRETRYQGVRDEHALVLDLGEIPSPESKVMLYLTGWIFYTDTSINVSLSQRRDVAIVPPLLEVPDGAGGWKTAIAALGFPAGKTKTMPVELTGLVDPKDPRVRIRTTSAIFWDEAFVTVDDPAVRVETTSLAPAKATLFLRGFSRGFREDGGPEVFDHDDVLETPRWEDVPGRLTRFGDVTDLLGQADDRWVAFQGGDAIRITYDASKLPPLREGYRRDYVLVSDGWDKDFDKNTITGTSVEPYPFHAMSAYPYPSGETYPDSLFLEEWMTRSVGPERFRDAIRK